MGVFTVTLPSGVEWTPAFAQSIDISRCVGCGRCFKVCLRNVLELRGVDEDGEFVTDEDDYERMVMTIAHPQRCVGCQACAMVCAKKCYTHAPAAA